MIADLEQRKVEALEWINNPQAYFPAGVKEAIRELLAPSPQVPDREVEEAINEAKLSILLTRKNYPKSSVVLGVSFEELEILIRAAQHPQREEWLDISSAPRDSSRVLVAYKNSYDEWRVHEAWWKRPYEGAADKQCSWCIKGDSVLLDASIHDGLGATHWQPLPSPPKAEK